MPSIEHSVHPYTAFGEKNFSAALILTFTPAGIERFFEGTLERLHEPGAELRGNVDEVAARYVAAAPRYGLEFV